MARPEAFLRPCLYRCLPPHLHFGGQDQTARSPRPRASEATIRLPFRERWEQRMDIEKYTDRSKGFIQSAQSLALREGHQQFTAEHLLKVLLDDPEGLAAGLIDRAGGRSRDALRETEAALAKLPKVSGGGAGQVYLQAALARIFDQA